MKVGVHDFLGQGEFCVGWKEGAGEGEVGEEVWVGRGDGGAVAGGQRGWRGKGASEDMVRRASEGEVGAEHRVRRWVR